MISERRRAVKRNDRSGDQMFGTRSRGSDGRRRYRLLRLRQELAHGTTVVVVRTALGRNRARAAVPWRMRFTHVPASVIRVPRLVGGNVAAGSVLVLEQVQPLSAGRQAAERDGEDASDQPVERRAHHERESSTPGR